MPELPEVETLKRALSPMIIGKTINAVWQSRLALRINIPPKQAQGLVGWRVTDVMRRGKNILWKLAKGDSNSCLLIHLGMSGRLRFCSTKEVREKHDHWEISFEEESIVLRYQDPRRFGGWSIAHSLTAIEDMLTLGQEPLSDILSPEIVDILSTRPPFNAQSLFQQTRQSQQPIKVWLMNGQNIAGIGNIYASEALFLAGINPARPAQKLLKKECATLVDGIHKILRQAIVAGGSTLRDYRQVDGEMGYFQFNFSVYDRAEELCIKCLDDRPPRHQKILHIVQAGRSTYYCPHCQS